MKFRKFSEFHPSVNVFYFAGILAFSMIVQHPLCRLLSLLGALCWTGQLLTKETKKTLKKILLPTALLAILINPAFSHEGVTILTYLPGGNPLTAESIWYGLSMAVMLAAVVLWCAGLHAVLTSDKLVCLTGKLAPTLSLLLSLTLRFVPRFARQLRQVSAARSAIGKGVREGSILERMRHGGQILSILVTWSLENAMDTADSMKSRGYGTGTRTAFCLYTRDEADRTAAMVIGGSLLFLLFMALHGEFYWRYYPLCRAGTWSLWSACTYLVYGLFCMLPWMLDRWEVRAWRSIE